MITTGTFAAAAVTTGRTNACESDGASTIPLTCRATKFSTN
jgi:hypothetical protein